MFNFLIRCLLIPDTSEYLTSPCNLSDIQILSVFDHTMHNNFWIKNYFGGTFSHLLAFNMPGWYRGIRISPYQATVFVIWQGPTSGPFQMLQLDIEICEYLHFLHSDSLCMKQGTSSILTMPIVQMVQFTVIPNSLYTPCICDIFSID